MTKVSNVRPLSVVLLLISISLGVCRSADALELPPAWQKLRQQIVTRAQDPNELRPVLAVVPILPAGEQEPDERSRALQQALLTSLQPDLPQQLIQPQRLQRILDDWNQSLRLQSRQLTPRELAGLAGADWLLSGTYSLQATTLTLQLKLRSLNTGQFLAEQTLEWSDDSTTAPPDPVAETQPPERLLDDSTALLPAPKEDMQNQKGSAASATQESDAPRAAVAAEEQAPVQPEMNEDMQIQNDEVPASRRATATPAPDSAGMTRLDPTRELSALDSAGRATDNLEQSEEPATATLELPSTAAMSRTIPSSTEKPGMVRVNGGRFRMGALQGALDEQPVRSVELASFYLDVHEVTNEAFDQCANCVRGSGGFDTAQPQQPVVYVDWENAARYCSFVNKRLPTEAEWEYAVRAGRANAEVTAEALTSFAWFQENAETNTQAATVATKRPNAWGIYDLQGNVLEWTADWYAPYGLTDLVNPQGPLRAESAAYPLKVVRGGAWRGVFGTADADALRPTKRFAFPTWTQSFQLGFRCAADAER